jgi:purine-binding chemotaxis protein CheW
VSFETSQVQPVPRIANGSRVNFLAGLITIEGAMIALIDLPNLLSVQIDQDEGASVAGPKLSVPSPMSLNN